MAGTSCPADNEIWLPNKNYMNVCGNIPVKPLVTGAGMRRGLVCWLLVPGMPAQVVPQTVSSGYQIKTM